MPQGDVEPIGLRIIGVKKSTSTAIVRGKVLDRDTSLTPDGFKIATTGAVKPFAVSVLKDAATTDDELSVAVEGIVILKAAGAIEPGALVKAAPSGEVVTLVVGTDANNLAVGMYLSKEGERVPTAATTGDNIRVLLGAN